LPSSSILLPEGEAGEAGQLMIEPAQGEGDTGAGADGGVKACSHAAFGNSMGYENKNLDMCSRRRMSLGLR